MAGSKTKTETVPKEPKAPAEPKEKKVPLTPSERDEMKELAARENVANETLMLKGQDVHRLKDLRSRAKLE